MNQFLEKNQSLEKLLLCSLTISVFPACGLEVDHGAGSYDSASNGADLYEITSLEATSHDGDVPTGTQLILAKDAQSAPEEMMLMDIYGLLLIDRSGSMATVRPSTGKTRCIDAIAQAKDQLGCQAR